MEVRRIIIISVQRLEGSIVTLQAGWLVTLRDQKDVVEILAKIGTMDGTTTVVAGATGNLGGRIAEPCATGSQRKGAGSPRHGARQG